MGKFQESKLAHELLDGLDGVELGGGAHNPFSIPGCKNINWTAERTLCTDEEIRLCGESLPVDIVAEATALPFDDNSIGYLIACHAIEHIWHPVKALQEWRRVVRPGGYVFLIVPHQDRCQPDDKMPTTTLAELIKRHSGETPVPADYGPGGYYGHRSFWRLPDFLELVRYLGFHVHTYLEVCDKVPNGFTVVLKK